MVIKNKIETKDFLKRCVNQKVKEIYVTGWTKIKDGINFFNPMPWYYYIEFENFLICIELDDLEYGLRFYIHDQIQCNFEEIFEDNEIFTIARANGIDYEGLEIESFDIFYSKTDNYPWALGLEFNKEKSFESSYVFFNGLSIDGINFGNRRDKDYYFGSDERFRLVKYPLEK